MGRSDGRVARVRRGLVVPQPPQRRLGAASAPVPSARSNAIIARLVALQVGESMALDSAFTMPPKQRQIRIEQRGALAAMQELE